MGILSKLARLLSADLGSLLGDPADEDAWTERLEALQEEISAAEAELAGALVHQKEVEADLAESRQEAERLEAEAGDALAGGDEGRARKLLLQRTEFLRNIELLEPNVEALARETGEARRRLQTLRRRLWELHSEQLGEAAGPFGDDAPPPEASIEDELRELERLRQVEKDLNRLRGSPETTDIDPGVWDRGNA